MVCDKLKQIRKDVFAYVKITKKIKIKMKIQFLIVT